DDRVLYLAEAIQERLDDQLLVVAVGDGLAYFDVAERRLRAVHPQVLSEPLVEWRRHNVGRLRSKQLTDLSIRGPAGNAFCEDPVELAVLERLRPHRRIGHHSE